MMAKDTLRAALTGVSLAALAACSAPPPDESLWLSRIEEDREIKDRFFR